jgi:hypothetical protein
MGLRESLLNLFGRGEAPEPDPDAWQELLTVRMFEAPMVIDRLAAAGIEVRQQEQLDLATRALSSITLFVKRADLGAAEEATAG